MCLFVLKIKIYFLLKAIKEAKSLVCVSEVLYGDSAVGKSYIFVVDIKWGYLVFMSQCSPSSVWGCPQYVVMGAQYNAFYALQVELGAFQV